MYTRILVPLDGSKLAEQVLPYVRLLGEHMQLPVTLLRAHEPIPADMVDAAHGVYIDRLLADERGAVGEYLQGIADELQQDGVSVTYTVAERAPAESILHETAHDPEGTLVAMSTHGRGGILKWVTGSVTEKVLHATSSPMLIVRPRDTDREPPPATVRTLLVPLDGSKIAEQAIPHAVVVARSLSAGVHLLRVTPYPAAYYRFGPYIGGPYQDFGSMVDQEATEYLNGIKEQVSGRGIDPVRSELLHGSAPVVLVDAVEESQDSMVVMTTHGRSGVSRWAFGSVAQRVMRHAANPVLVVRASEE